MRDDYVLNLRNVNATGDSVQEFKIPWRSIRDFLRYIGFENAPFDAMTGAYPLHNRCCILQTTSAMTSYWATTDRESGASRQDTMSTESLVARPLVDGEKRMLMNADSDFWTRRMSDGKEAFLRLDKAVVLSEPNPQTLRK